jgi:hypothetical protein
VENRNNFEFDDEQEKTRGSEYGDVPSMTSHHTTIDTAQIKPTGTGCRACIIFILIIGAVLGFLYFHYNQSQNQPGNQPAPTDTPSGQTQP